MGLFASPSDKAIKLITEFTYSQYDSFAYVTFPKLEEFIEKHSKNPEKCPLLWEICLICAICYDTGISGKRDPQKALEYYEKVRELTKYHRTPDYRKYAEEFLDARLGSSLENTERKMKGNPVSDEILTLRLIGYAAVKTYSKSYYAFFNNSKTQWTNFFNKAKEVGSYHSETKEECKKICDFIIDIIDAFHSSANNALSTAIRLGEKAQGDDYLLFLLAICHARGNNLPFSSDLIEKAFSIEENTITQKDLSEIFMFKSALEHNAQATYYVLDTCLKSPESQEAFVKSINYQEDTDFLSLLEIFALDLLHNARNLIKKLNENYHEKLLCLILRHMVEKETDNKEENNIPDDILS